MFRTTSSPSEEINSFFLFFSMLTKFWRYSSHILINFYSNKCKHIAGYAGSFLFRYHKPQNMTVRQDLFVEFLKGDRAVDVTYFYPAVGFHLRQPKSVHIPSKR